MSMSKKAITLSINSLVIIILSLVILSLGIVLMRAFFKSTAEIKAQIDAQTESKIASLLAEGEPLAVPVNRKTIQAKKHSTFGLGILNIIQEPGQNTFIINIRFSGAYDRMNNVISIDAETAEGWLLYDEDSFTLQANEQKIIPILVAVPPSAPGTYIFTIEVQDAVAGTRYNSLQKIYVEVP